MQIAERRIMEKREILKGVTVIDLFSGIGGFHLAFSAFGAKVIYASEWDKDAVEVYEKNFKIKPEGDITKIDAASIPDHDILCAGFPCQAFSISGKKEGFNDSRGTLFFDVARIVKEKQPKIVFLENVKNLEGHDNGRTLKVIISTLKELGYEPYYKVLNASDYNVPQSRQRIYIVAFRNDLTEYAFDFPKPIKLKRHVKDILLPDEETTKYIINRSDVCMKSGYIEEETNKPLRIGIVNKGGQGERIYSPYGTAITLSAYGGGAGAKTGLYKINGVIRKLAPRECARLMGFPDKYKIAENDNVAYKQFGNSVVVDVLRAIISEITKDERILKWLKAVQK